MVFLEGNNEQKVYVLDGGFSSQISKHVGTTADGDPLWSARFLQTHPEDVLNTHLDFLRAGADIVSTNTYQASVSGFVKHLGVTAEEGHGLIHLAVELAKRARDTYNNERSYTSLSDKKKIYIAGSVGPYGAHLHDGSEYDGSYANKTAAEIIRDWHKPRIDTLVSAGVDLLALETVPCQKEAEVLVQLLKEYPSIKAWISFSCKDDASLAHGENFETVARKCFESNPDQILAVGANCCSPKIVANLIRNLNKNRQQIPIVTYPNSGEKYCAEMGWIDKDKCESLHTFIHSWLDLGVQYVGGCCRTYKEDISLIHAAKVFGISARKTQRDNYMTCLLKENEDLKDENVKLTLEISRLKKDMDKMKDNNFTDYLSLMRERDARYTLYFENVSLQLQLKELDGSSYQASQMDYTYGDPVVLRIALDRTREQLSATQSTLNKMSDEYSDTVPRREYDLLEARYYEITKKLDALTAELEALQTTHKRVIAHKKGLEEELMECKERCRELERAGTPRPQWENCADFIGGGRDRWWQLASGLSSREMLRVLLKELGPAADSDHLEYFDGLGMDPVVPPYLRHEGKVRNLRLSRREVSVIINDIWLGKLQAGHDLSMQDYVTKYFEDRYQQPSVRAEWAYNLCAGVEQMLDEPQVKLFWGVLHGHLSEDIYWSHRAQWQILKDQLYRQSKDGESITVEEFEKTAKSTFPLKSEVDIKNLTDVVKKQLKMKINTNEINLDKLFFENEEGFERAEFARELYRQRQLTQDKYIREVVAELGGKQANKRVTVEGLKRAFAIVDPAINHVRMERYIRWAFSDQSSDMTSICPLPLRSIAARLAAGDIERVGPRYRGMRRRK